MEERRTVQFLIERLCPETSYHPTVVSRVKNDLPFPVWVIWPPIAKVNPQADCGSDKYFQVQPEEAQAVHEKFGKISGGNNRVVCKHMGHVIE